MYEARFGKIPLDPEHVRDVGRRRINPAICALFACNGVHHDSQEIAGARALGQDLGFDFLRLQARNAERLALEPLLHHLFLVLQHAQIPVNGLKNIEYVHLSMKLSEAARGKQQVVQETCA